MGGREGVQASRSASGWKKKTGKNQHPAGTQRRKAGRPHEWLKVNGESQANNAYQEGVEEPRRDFPHALRVAGSRTGRAQARERSRWAI